MAVPITSRILTQRRIPTINRSDVRTHSVSDSPRVFIGNLAKWDNFELSVRQTFRNQTWNQNAITWERPDNFYDREQVACSTESAVVGRFMQNIGHVMTCVGINLGMQLRFGHWHGEQDAIPDITIWTQNSEALVAGEAKTPWTVNLSDITETNHFQNFIRSAGQVAHYMESKNYRYGFLTTYDDTIFFKQEVCTMPMAVANNLSTDPLESVLWYSNPIHHNIQSADVPHGSSPLAYADHVSVRECMLYLMRMVDTPGSHRAVTRGSWTTEAGVPSNEEVTILKSPSAPSAVKRPPYLSGPQTRASSSRQPQSTSGDAGSLADQMDGLRLKEKHSQTAAPASSEPKKVHVRWSSKRNSYMYTVRGEEKKVDTHTHHKGSLWVKIKGERYLATETS